MVQKSKYQKLAKFCDKRPCLVYPAGERKIERAFFYGWTYDVDVYGEDDMHGSTYGIVEYVDGCVDVVHPLEIKFVDGGQFDQFKWPDLPENEE